MKKCRYDCLTCPYVEPNKTIKGTATNFKQDIQGSVDCQTQNVVYLITCNKCKQQYVGQTERTLSLRFSEHRGYVNTKKIDKATGQHFNKAGYNLSNMRVSIIEKVHSKNPHMREIRESKYINKLNTFHKGMNKKE